MYRLPRSKPAAKQPTRDEAQQIIHAPDAGRIARVLSAFEFCLLMWRDTEIKHNL
jgi:hypothetical protein